MRLLSALTLALATGLAPLVFAGDWAASWESMRSASRDVSTIQADFVQSRSLKILARPIVSFGTLTFRRPADLRWEYKSPIETVLIMREGKLSRYIRRDGKFTIDSAARLDAMSFVFGEINLWLGGNFTASKMFQPELVRSSAATSIKLMPIDTSMRSIVGSVTLELGSKPGAVSRIVVDEGAEGSTRIDFSDVRINDAVSDEAFVAR